MLIKKREGTRFKYLNDSKVLIENSNDMDDIPGKYGKNTIQKTPQSNGCFWWYDCCHA